MTDILNRFLTYVAFDTQSDENSSSVPSTSGQLVFARHLVAELRSIGVADVELTDNGYIYASLPANCNKAGVPAVGFIAHMDTSPDCSGRDIHPKILHFAPGQQSLVLNAEKQIVMPVSEFPELALYEGQDLICTDGTTLLGADDKAGVAAIVSAVEYLVAHPEIQHGNVCIAFTPDEEIGRGADCFDVKRFGADFAYTIDGGRLGELEYETFNAAQATITFFGSNVHPGSALGKMRNSIELAMQFASQMPQSQKPETTSARQGFFHLTQMDGTVEQSTLHYIIRDFDTENFRRRKEYIVRQVDNLNAIYGVEVARADVQDQYHNMREKIEPVMHIVDYARQVISQRCGVAPIVSPVRGGTDGARLSFMGLPTPNIFAGGENFHGKYEFLPVESLRRAQDVVVGIAELVASKSK